MTRKYSQLFVRLGKLSGAYSIKFENQARPYALTTPRRVPIPPMKAVKEELGRMEEVGVIARKKVPTEWCAGMVVVSSVRICVDLAKLNQSVMRE